MKKANTVLSVFLFLLANFVYIIWMPYPKGILTKLSPYGFAFYLIKNILFFVVYAVILICSVSSIVHPGKRLPKKLIFITIPIVFGVQFAFDIVNWLCEVLVIKYYYIATDILTAVEFLVLILLCIKIVRGSIVNKKKFFTVCGCALVVILAVFIIIDLKEIREYNALAEKYQVTLIDMLATELDTPASAFASNIAFIWETRNALLSSVVSTIVILALSFSVPERENVIDSIYPNITRLICRIIFSVISAFGVCVVIMLALPYGSMLRSHMFSTMNSPTYPDFEYAIKDLSRCRGTGYGSANEVYHKTTYVLGYDNKEMLTFFVDGETHGECFEVFDIDGEKVKVAAKMMAVCYMKNGEPVCFDVRNSGEAEYDKVLVSTYEMLLEKGRVACFEYVAPYLLKYDSDFITPYIERYKNGNFTQEELEQMEFIKSEYIKKCAEELAYSFS